MYQKGRVTPDIYYRVCPTIFYIPVVLKIEETSATKKDSIYICMTCSFLGRSAHKSKHKIKYLEVCYNLFQVNSI